MSENKRSQTLRIGDVTIIKGIVGLPEEFHGDDWHVSVSFDDFGDRGNFTLLNSATGEVVRFEKGEIARRYFQNG